MAEIDGDSTSSAPPVVPMVSSSSAAPVGEAVRSGAEQIFAAPVNPSPAPVTAPPIASAPAAIFIAPWRFSSPNPAIIVASRKNSERLAAEKSAATPVTSLPISVASITSAASLLELDASSSMLKPVAVTLYPQKLAAACSDGKGEVLPSSLASPQTGSGNGVPDIADPTVAVDSANFVLNDDDEANSTAATSIPVNDAPVQVASWVSIVGNSCSSSSSVIKLKSDVNCVSLDGIDLSGGVLHEGINLFFLKIQGC